MDKTQLSCQGNFPSFLFVTSAILGAEGCEARALLFRVYVAFQSRLLLQDTLMLLEAAQNKISPCKHVSINFLIYTRNNIPIDHAKIVI